MGRNRKRALLGMVLGAAFALGGIAEAQTAVAPAPSEGDHNTVSEVTVTARTNKPARAGGPDGPMTANGLLDPPAEAPKSRSCEAEILSSPQALDAVTMAFNGDGVMPRIYQPTRRPRNPDYAATAVAPDGKPVVEAAPFWTPRTINLKNPSRTDVAAMACRIGHVRGEVILPGEVPRITLDSPDGFMVMGRSEIAGRDTTLPTALALFDEGRYQQALEYFEKAYAKLSHTDGGDEAALYIGKLHLFAPIEGADRAKGLERLEWVALAPFSSTLDMPTFDPTEPERNTAIGEAAMILAQLYLNGGAGVARGRDLAVLDAQHPRAPFRRDVAGAVG